MNTLCACIKSGELVAVSLIHFKFDANGLACETLILLLGFTTQAASMLITKLNVNSKRVVKKVCGNIELPDILHFINLIPPIPFPSR